MPRPENINGNAGWRTLYPFESHFCEIDGHRLHYLDEGSGPVVVMLHGNPTWSFYYRDLVLALRHTHRCIVPDHMGCGLSDKPQRYPYRLRNHIANLEWLLDRELGLEKAALVVHDWGGAIGMGYAARHPQRISRLVVLNTAAFLLPECPWRIRICQLPVFGSVAIRCLNAFAGAATRMAMGNGRKLTGAVRQGFLFPYDSYANRIANLRFVQDIPLRQNHPTWSTLEEIEESLPRLAEKAMLICWGEQDFCFTTAFLDEWTRRFPNARVHRFPEAGHYILEDACREVLPLIRGFLQADPGMEIEAETGPKA